MEKRNKKTNIYNVMRALHRDIGFLTIGLTIVYALSGVLLIYRNTDFMKVERIEEKQLATNLTGNDLGTELKIRNFRVEREDGSVIYFNNGSYDTATGKSVVTRKVYIPPFDKLVNLHKVTGANKLSFISMIYGCMLAFLAVSSLFMFKFGSKKNKRGLIMMAASIAATIVLVMFL